MEWRHPGWLYLILPLAAAWLLLSLYSRRRRLRAAEAFAGQVMRSRILPADSRARFWVKTAAARGRDRDRSGRARRSSVRNAV